MNSNDDNLFDDLKAVEEIDSATISKMPSSLPPKLAMGLVKAQAAAVTVDNDGYNAGLRYKYATAAAIACRTREACSAGGIAILMMGWEIVREDNRARVRVPVDVIHESGEVLPTFYASIPIIVDRGKGPDKALAGALSILRKYVCGQLLNMGWSDPSEDVDQRDDEKTVTKSTVLPKPNHSTTRPQLVTKPKDKPKITTPGVPDYIKESAKNAIRILKADFGFTDLDVIYKVATGLDSTWPGNPSPVDFMAIQQLAAACELAKESGEAAPQTHSAFTELCSTQDSPLYESFYADGKVTKHGTEAMKRLKESMRESAEAGQ